MTPDEDATSPTPERPGDPDTLVDRRFTEIVSALRSDDPRFVRRCSTSAPGGMARADLMGLVAVLATLVLGVVPLAVGVHTHLVALLVAGVAGCLLAPTLLPWAVSRGVRRCRPLWV